MAVSKEADQAIFDALNAAFVADTGTSGLNKVSMTAGAYDSANVLIGNVTGGTAALIRRGDPKATKLVPRVEVEVLPTGEVDTPDHARAQALARLYLVTNRETPSGFGSQNQVAPRVRSVFHRASLAATGGWTFSTLRRQRGFQLPPTEKEQVYVTEYALTMSAGSGGGF